MEFKDRLKECRKRLKMTQKQLGEESGLALGTIKQYETGKRLPNYEALIILCKSLCVSADYLVGLSYSYTK